MFAEQESKTLRINDIHELLHQLPEPNFEMLEVLIAHLRRLAFNVYHHNNQPLELWLLGVYFCF